MMELIVLAIGENRWHRQGRATGFTIKADLIFLIWLGHIANAFLRRRTEESCRDEYRRKRPIFQYMEILERKRQFARSRPSLFTERIGWRIYP
ncbi:hypothetical protein ACQZ52_09785 [Agrobacterium rosae]